MKKVLLSLFASILFLSVISNSVFAENGGSWYVKRNGLHKQPEIEPEFSYIENLSGYYVDKKHGDECDERVIYLTFDAGYENGNIEKILDVLKEEDVRAAFFVLEHLIRDRGELVKRMTSDGHVVSNHTMSHKDMTRVNREEFVSELVGLENLYREVTGEEMGKFYRPPRGQFSMENLKWAKEMGYKTVFWSFAYADWDNENQPSPDCAMKKILDNLHNGEIILLHPTSDTNAKIMKELIVKLKNDGYSFGTLYDL